MKASRFMLAILLIFLATAVPTGCNADKPDQAEKQIETAAVEKKIAADRWGVRKRQRKLLWDDIDVDLVALGALDGTLPLLAAIFDVDDEVRTARERTSSATSLRFMMKVCVAGTTMKSAAPSTRALSTATLPSSGPSICTPIASISISRATAPPLRT